MLTVMKASNKCIKGIITILKVKSNKELTNLINTWTVNMWTFIFTCQINEICVLKLKVKSELLYYTYRWQVPPFKTLRSIS
jgi:hypothetical protein